MRRTVTIFLKELKDILRDRRTIIMMIIMPMVITPMLIVGILKVQRMQQEKAMAKEIHIAFLGEEYAPELYQMFREGDKIILIDYFPVDSITTSIAAEEIDGAVVIKPEFPDQIQMDKQGKIEVFFKSSDAYGSAIKRMTDLIESYDKQIVEERIDRLSLDKDLFDAVAIVEQDVSSAQERIGKIAGGYLPYMFIIFSFMGTMYPGIDLGAGEKERGTLETILSSPANRLQIVLGKLGVVSLSGIISAFIAILGIYLAVQLIEDIPKDMLQVILDMLGFKIIVTILTLVIPIAIFFAALILSISIYAKSFKEAQSIIGPANIIIVIPVIIGLLPGIELDYKTALIPILNVSLASKDLLAGTLNPWHLVEVYLSLFLLGGIGVWGCVRWFNREETLFRT
ncbi:MAG: ABC transporter permease [Fidelibacterota bacterium]